MMKGAWLLAVVPCVSGILVGVPTNALSAPETTVSFSLGDLSFSVRQGYDLVELAACGLDGQPGHPLLPRKVLHFVIPRDKVVASVRLEPKVKRRLMGRFYIYPAQPDSFWWTGGFAQPDPGIYGSADPHPGNAVEECGEMVAWGWNTFKMKLWPLEYIPAKGELWLYQTVDISLELVDGQPPSQEVLPRTREQHEEWAKELEEAVENPGDVWAWAPGGAIARESTPKWALVLPNNMPPYLWLQEFSPLLTYRQAQGYEVTVGYVNEILGTYPGDTDEQKVRNYLRAQGARWALLAGDDELVPMMDYGPFKSFWGWTDIHEVLHDWYYCDLDGEEWPEFGEPWPMGFDWCPECWVGRVPCTTPEEAGNFVQKVLEYEQYNGNPSYLGRALYETADYAQEEEYTIERVIAFQDPQVETTCLKEIPDGYAQGPTSPTADEVLDLLNSFADVNKRFGVVTVHCHGGSDDYACLTDGNNGGTISAFGPYYIESLANEGQYFFWYSISCLNANLDYWDGSVRTVAERSTCVHPARGAVAFAGITESTITGIQANLQCYAWSLLYPTTVLVPRYFNHAGRVEANSKWEAEADSLGLAVGSRARFAHNLFGGPATPIWTPKAMPAAKRRSGAEEAPALLTIDLLACDPNPVQSNTTLRLSFSRPAWAEVGVYDVTGRLVQFLYEGTVAAGTTTERWDSSHLAQGVYTVRVKGDGLVTGKSIVVLR
jgi:hypothetical protein